MQMISNEELVKERDEWKAFALSLWGIMDLCDKDEKCTKQLSEQVCPCDYYKKLVLNK